MSVHSRRRKPAWRVLSVLPMEVRVGDRFTDEEGEWDVVRRPTAFREGHLLEATVRQHDELGLERTVRWPAHDKVHIRRRTVGDGAPIKIPARSRIARRRPTRKRR